MKYLQVNVRSKYCEIFASRKLGGNIVKYLQGENREYLF